MSSITVEEIHEPEQFDLAYRIRHAVFCIEQRVDEAIEFDGLDERCRHYLARLDGATVGTARVRPLDAGGAKIERVAVLKAKRGLGIGRALMDRAIADLRAIGVDTAMIHAQTHAQGFYRTFGFVREGPEFFEANIPHIRMTLAL